MNEANRREWDVSDDKKYTQERYGHLVNASVKVAEWLAAMGRPVQPKRTVTVSGKELGKALAILRKRTPSQKALKDFGQQNNPLFKALHLTAFHGFLHLEVYGLDKDGKAEVVRECVRIDGWWDKSPEWETFVAASGLLDSARFLDGFDITLELWQPYSVYLTVTAHVLDKVVNMQRVPLLNV